jgi:hypothetical protein
MPEPVLRTTAPACSRCGGRTTTAPTLTANERAAVRYAVSQLGTVAPAAAVTVPNPPSQDALLAVARGAAHEHHGTRDLPARPGAWPASERVVPATPDFRDRVIAQRAEPAEWRDRVAAHQPERVAPPVRVAAAGDEAIPAAPDQHARIRAAQAAR